MSGFKEQLQKTKLLSSYLLYGDENYLIRHYTETLRQTVVGEDVMNVEQFEGKKTAASRIIEAAETLPFLGEKRLVLVKDSGLFTSGRKADSEQIAAYFEHLPESACIVFAETDVDKRGKAFKAASKYGMVYPCVAPSEKELLLWITKYFQKQSLAIQSSTASFFIRTVGGEMDHLFQEMEKLASFCSQKKSIEPEDVRNICTQALESRIFDLVGAIGRRDTDQALQQYHNMLQKKESPFMILTMMARQFRIIFQCKLLLEQGESTFGIAKLLGQRDFVVRECAKQAGFFSLAELKQAVIRCPETDAAIKQGKLEAASAVEFLILENANI